MEKFHIMVTTRQKSGVLPRFEKFEGHGAAQAGVITDGDNHGLVSYQTLVATIDYDGWLTVTGLYSTTTRKHLGWFMQKYGADYHKAKYCVENHVKYNVRTGEIKEVK